MSAKLEALQLQQVSRPLDFNVGDTVAVHYRIKEGNKERIQVYEGVVIAINNALSNKSFIVRRISYDVGVERIFPLNAPTIAKIEKVRSGRVRRSKLYFLRKKQGKAARLKEIKRQAAADQVFNKAEESRKAAADKAAQAEAAQKEAEAAEAAANEAPAEDAPAENQES